MKVVHIMPREKFTERFLNFIFDNFDFSEHFFFITGEFTEYKIDSAYMSHIVWIKDYRELYQRHRYKKIILECDKIIINGVWGNEMMLFHFPGIVLRKTCLFFWGSEIYMMRNNIPLYEIRKILKRAAKKYLIKNAGIIITLVKGDYQILQTFVKTRGKHFVARMASNRGMYDMQESMVEFNKPDNPYYVLLGNSATGSNHHFEMIDLLEKYKGMNVRFLCPLSYGDEKYARDVIQYGKCKLGNKFVPLTEFMDAESYYHLLNKCSAGIFNNDRQQALGNILALLRFGAKVYLRMGTSMWDFLIENGMLVYNIKQISEDFIQVSRETQQKNHDAVIEYLKMENAVNEWKEVFNSII